MDLITRAPQAMLTIIDDTLEPDHRLLLLDDSVNTTASSSSLPQDPDLLRGNTLWALYRLQYPDADLFRSVNRNYSIKSKFRSNGMITGINERHNQKRSSYFTVVINTSTCEKPSKITLIYTYNTRVLDTLVRWEAYLLAVIMRIYYDLVFYFANADMARMETLKLIHNQEQPTDRTIIWDGNTNGGRFTIDGRLDCLSQGQKDIRRCTTILEALKHHRKSLDLRNYDKICLKKRALDRTAIDIINNTTAAAAAAAKNESRSTITPPTSNASAAAAADDTLIDDYFSRIKFYGAAIDPNFCSVLEEAMNNILSEDSTTIESIQ